MILGEARHLPACLPVGLLLRQLHRLGEEAASALGCSAQDADKDVRQSLVTVFNSRPDMCVLSSPPVPCF